jgi:hypothetical protein
LGDEVVSFGFGMDADVWSGIVAKQPDYVHLPCVVYQNQPFNVSKPYCCPDEYRVTANQHGGQSGGAVANGCGYLGMAHVTITTPSSSFAGIVSAKTISQFIMENWNKLKTWADCSQKLDIVELPVMPHCKTTNH